MEFILMLSCIRIRVERDAETMNRNRNSTKSAAQKQRQKIQTAIQRKIQQCTYVLMGMTISVQAHTSTTYPPRQTHEPNTHAPQQKL